MADDTSAKVLDPVNASMLTLLKEHGRTALGLHSNIQWHEDPRHLLFSMARYKFVAKMLAGARNVLEVGCGDGFNARIILQEVDALTLTDIDPLFVSDARDRSSPPWTYRVDVHDMTVGPYPGSYDAIYTLDVLEHVPQAKEDLFIEHAMAALAPHGTMIVGMPTLESQAFSKPASETGHINCKSLPELKALMSKYFHNVFMFSMNDEVVHTGYHSLTHYVIAVCCGSRREDRR